MDIEKERKAFEAWFVEAYNVRPTRHGDGYQSPMTDFMWASWQARAKQTITLPVKDATGEH